MGTDIAKKPNARKHGMISFLAYTLISSMKRWYNRRGMTTFYHVEIKSHLETVATAYRSTIEITWWYKYKKLCIVRRNRVLK